MKIGPFADSLDARYAVAHVRWATRGASDGTVIDDAVADKTLEGGAEAVRAAANLVLNSSPNALDDTLEIGRLSPKGITPGQRVGEGWRTAVGAQQLIQAMRYLFFGKANGADKFLPPESVDPQTVRMALVIAAAAYIKQALSLRLLGPASNGEFVYTKWELQRLGAQPPPPWVAEAAKSSHALAPAFALAVTYLYQAKDAPDAAAPVLDGEQRDLVWDIVTSTVHEHVFGTSVSTFPVLASMPEKEGKGVLEGRSPICAASGATDAS